MIDTKKVLNVVKNTSLEQMDGIKVMMDESEAFGFVSWEGTQNIGRWFGYIVYQNTEGIDSATFTGQGTSPRGYATKENAFKYAMLDFEEIIKHIYL